MGIVIDLVIIAILLINVIIGYKKGLMEVLVSACAFIIAIAATFILYKPISMVIINNTSIDDKIKETILSNNSGEQTEENSEEQSMIEKYVTSKIQDATIEAKNEAIEAIADTVSIKAVEIITAIILFIAVRIIVVLLKFFTELIGKIPVIEQFNEIGGVLYGLIKSAIIIYILLMILFMIVSINGNGMIQEAIDTSYITKFLFENNVITIAF